MSCSYCGDSVTVYPADTGTSLGIVFGRSVAEIVAKRHSCSKTNILSFLAYEEAIFAEVVAWKGIKKFTVQRLTNATDHVTKI